MTPTDDSIANLPGRAQSNQQCPDEAQILGFFEGKLIPGARDEIQGHLVDCADCRELIALFVHSAGVSQSGVGPSEAAGSQPLADLAVRNQVARVLSMIEQDEARMAPKATESKVSKRRSLFGLSLLQLAAAAVAICAIGTAVLVLTRRDSPASSAMKALALARGDQRRIPVRTSANLPHARYTETRGGTASSTNTNEMQFDRALNLLRFAEEPSAPAESRLALARVYLERAKPGDASRARKLLLEIEAGGQKSAGLLNDIGVALFQLDEYEQAAAYFGRSLEARPDYNEALFNIALTHQRMRRDSEAMREWQQFISVSSEEEWKEEARDHLLILEKTRR